MGGAHRPFPTTRHSLIRSAAGTGTLAREALDAIVAVYWKPAYKHVRIQWRRSNEEAKDLVQGFFTALIEQQILAGFDPSKARFRTYLKGCLDHFVMKQDERANRLKTEALARRSGRKISLEDVFRLAQEGAVKELNLVLKGDVSGSVEAVEDEIAKLPQNEVSVNIIHRGVGGINESDVMLAAASDAVILAFNVRPVGDARALAEREGVEIRSYSVIYRAIDELRAAMQGMLEPEEVEETVGQVEVRQTFRASRIGTIAGSFVVEGKVTRGAKVRVVRDGTVIQETTIATLRRFSEDVREVSAGFECGIVLANFQDIKDGDVLEVFETRKVERALA